MPDQSTWPHLEQGPHIAGIGEVLRRRLGVILIACIVVPAAALAASLTQEKQYTAAASLLFRDPALDQKLFGSTFLQQSSDPDREAATNVRLVSLDVVAARTAARVGGGLTQEQVSSKITVSTEGGSDVVSVEATDHDPGRAARLADAFVTSYVALRRNSDRSKIQQAQRSFQRQYDQLSPEDQDGDKGRSLLERSDQLELLASLQTGNAEVVQEAETPSAPSSPKPVRNSLLGLAFGVLLGIALALLFERLDRRLKDPKEVEHLFGRPILGAIPESRAFSMPDQDPRGLPVGEAESFRMLRANLRYFNVARDIRSVLITSAAPSDGKSTVAWYLAAAAAGTGSSTLLLEADLRHPSLGSRLTISGARGLSQVLAGDPLENAINQVPVATAHSGGSARTLDVVVAGSLPPNPTDLLESERMREIIHEAEQHYDLVVIDTPPTSVVSDAVPLVPRVSGVIVVCRLGKTTRGAANQLRGQLENLDAPTLGVVVNSVDAKRAGYGYGYGYEADGAGAVGSVGEVASRG